MTRVKICGVTSPGDRDAVVDAGADAFGVISGVTVDTPREVDEDTAAALVAGAPPLVTSVLVTMPDAVQKAVRRVDAVTPDVVQVHDGLSPGEIGALSRRVDARVVAAVEAEQSDAQQFADNADALLVDSVDADGGGGTGETHDWERTRDIVSDLDVPVILAGGLTPDNVAEAVETAQPFAVDVASGVESEGVERSHGDRDARRSAQRSDGGVKDHDAVETFIARAKTAGTEVST